MSFGFGFGFPRGAQVSGAPAWTPADLGASLALWLDAEDTATVTLNGSNVSQWDDKSGNGRNVSQATASSQPAYQATGFAGKPGIYFNGTATHLFNTSPFMYAAGSVSVFSAMRPAPTAINQFFLAEGYSASTSPIYAPIVNRSTFDLNDQSVYYRTDSGGGTSGVLLFDNGMAEANRIVGLTDSGTQFIAYNNGTTGSSVTYSRTATTLNRFAIGGLLRATFALAMPSNAGEIVVATGVLSTTDRQKLEGYLAWKWGLAENLPNDHPYRVDGTLFGFGSFNALSPSGSDLLVTSDGDVFIVQ